MNSSVITDSETLALREFHPFKANGVTYLYMVPSAGIFRMDGPSDAILETLSKSPKVKTELIDELSSQFDIDLLLETIDELIEIRAIGDIDAPKDLVPNDLPPAGFPLTTMVLNVTNKCNLACTYCYEYGEDKIVDTQYGDCLLYTSPSPRD